MEEKKKIAFVSLGMNCAPATQLRKLGLRKEAYPFDWLISEHIESCLEDDFKFFFLDWKINEKKNAILNHYGFWFTHDFPRTIPDHQIVENWNLSVPEIQKKYQRRIQRFRNLCQSTEYMVVLLRHGNGSFQQGKNILRIMETQYPKCSFHLILIHTEPIFMETHPQIEFFLFQEKQIWETLEKWSEMVTSLQAKFHS